MFLSVRHEIGAAMARLPRVRRSSAPRLRHATWHHNIQRYEEFMSSFDLELERSRRYERPFSLSRFELAEEPRDADRVALAISQRVRCVDVVSTINDEVVVLWTETSSQIVDTVVAHLLSRSGQRIQLVRSVTFPDDGLTRAALVRDLFGCGRDDRVEGTALDPPSGEDTQPAADEDWPHAL